MSDFSELVKTRTSVRRYRAEELPHRLIDRCIDAARYAPTACNTQCCRFIVVEGGMKERLVSDCLGEVPVRNDWAAEAPVIVVLAVEKDFLAHRIGGRVKGLRYELIDAGIAGQHLVLQAAELGIGTCWIGWFRKARLRKLLAIPGSWEIVALIAMGYAAEPGEAVERLPLERVRSFRR